MTENKEGFNEISNSPKDNVFSYFIKPIQNIKPSKEINLFEAWQLITGNDFEQVTTQLRSIEDIKAAKRFKASNFDYVTFNGTFTERADTAAKTASSYFTVDVDNIGEQLMQFRESIINDKVLCPQLVFISPRGNGLKIILKIDTDLLDLTANSKRTNTIWQSVNTYFSIHYANLITPTAKMEFIDPACKDLSRACFICHDATAFLNINNSGIIDADFISKYPPLLVEKFKAQKNKTSNDLRQVSPTTTLEDLAARHLNKKDNHHKEILAFVSAANTIGTPIEQTLNYLKNYVHISPQSAHSDTDKLTKEVEDIYNRYNTNSEGIHILTPITFGYKILYFKYSREAKAFILSSLFLDEIRKILHNAGFAKRKVGKNFVYIQKNGCIISEVSPENMRDYMTGYVDSIEDSICFSYQNKLYQIPPAAIRETYLKNSNNIFNKAWLEHLQEHTEPLLKDKEHEMYFFFKNVIVTVSKDGINTEDWKDKTGFCIWDEQIIQHNFDFVEDFIPSHFYKFLRNVTNNDESRLITMVTGIGYLLHHSFKESEGQTVILYDETITDTRTPQGGSGKGLIVNAIKQVRKVTKIDGKHLDATNRFKWELVTPSTQIVWLDDVKPDFDFSILHSTLTDGWTIERKYLSQFTIDTVDSPKTVICSNSIIKGGGTTNLRRQFIIELSDFYSRQIKTGNEKPIEQTHGCIFFSKAWQLHEWNMFFSLMVDCAYQFFNSGFVYNKGVNVELNRFRQATNEDFATWIEDQDLQPNQRYETKKYYEPFVQLFYGSTHIIGQRTFTNWLRDYAAYKGWIFEVKQSNGIPYFLFKSV